MECKRCDSRVKNHSQEHDGRAKGGKNVGRVRGKGRGKNATKGTEIDATRGKNAGGGSRTKGGSRNPCRLDG